MLLQRNPEDGLRIFTEEMSEVEALPRDTVLKHLGTIAPNLEMAYLVSLAAGTLSNVVLCLPVVNLPQFIHSGSTYSQLYTI